jgi:hypothetical protein
MNMNRSDAATIPVLHTRQIQSNPIQSFTGPFPSEVKCWRLQDETNTTRQFEQTTIGTYFYIYLFFYIFLAIGIQFQIIFSSSCFYQIMIYLVVTAIPILFPSRVRYDTTPLNNRFDAMYGYFLYI